MAQLVSGQVVVVPFPFTDLSAAKVRPAVVLAVFSRGDVLLGQITSQSHGHPQAIPVTAADFGSGEGLPMTSYALPHRIVTAHETCIRRTVGNLTAAKLHEIREAVCLAIRKG